MERGRSVRHSPEFSRDERGNLRLIAGLSQRIAELEAEVAYWREREKVEVDMRRARLLAQSLGLRPAEAWLLDALFRDGGTISKERLQRDRPSALKQEQRVGNQVQVFVTRIRAKLGRRTIVTCGREGYRIGAEGAEICRIVLEGQGAELDGERGDSSSSPS